MRIERRPLGPLLFALSRALSERSPLAGREHPELLTDAAELRRVTPPHDREVVRTERGGREEMANKD